MRNGKTVEVLNTDAEGRLVMADGLSIACESKPDLLVDVATLTGAAKIALGNRYAGLMGTELAVNQIKSAATRSGELVWAMPLPEELRSLLDSESADLANAKVGNRAGGMLLAAVFLKEFVDKEIEWAHLDIASSANNAGAAWGHTPAGATGVGVRTIFAAAAALANRLG
jgi:leucyl aminopeptidase